MLDVPSVAAGEILERSIEDGNMQERGGRKLLNRREKEAEVAYVQAPIAPRPFSTPP